MATCRSSHQIPKRLFFAIVLCTNLAAVGVPDVYFCKRMTLRSADSLWKQGSEILQQQIIMVITIFFDFENCIHHIKRRQRARGKKHSTFFNQSKLLKIIISLQLEMPTTTINGTEWRERIIYFLLRGQGAWQMARIVLKAQRSPKSAGSESTCHARPMPWSIFHSIVLYQNNGKPLPNTTEYSIARNKICDRSFFH